MKLSDQQAAELERLVSRFIAIQTEPTAPPSCSACACVWGNCNCPGGLPVPSLDARFARQVELVPQGLELLKQAHQQAAREEQERFIADLAAKLLPWESAGDEAAAQLAVRAARQLLAAAKRDAEPLGAPS